MINACIKIIKKAKITYQSWKANIHHHIIATYIQNLSRTTVVILYWFIIYRIKITAKSWRYLQYRCTYVAMEVRKDMGNCYKHTNNHHSLKQYFIQRSHQDLHQWATAKQLWTVNQMVIKFVNTNKVFLKSGTQFYYYTFEEV